MPRGVLTAIVCLAWCVAACSENAGRPGADAWAGDGLPPWDLGPGGDGTGHDHGIPAPATLPTFVKLDWGAFPDDPGPAYKPTGRTWVVKTTGNDSAAGTESAPLRTIARGLSRAQPGDMVKVHGGTYHEGDLQMKRSRVILTAAPGQQVTVAGSSGWGITIEGDNTVLNGINLRGFHPIIHVGLSSREQRNVVISNLTAEGGSQSHVDGIITYAAGSAGRNVIKGLLIKNVTVRNADMAISCNDGPCSSWKMENVKVIGRGTAGGNSYADGIAIEDGDNMLFYNVEVTRASADAIDTKATRVVVWNCDIHHIGRNGIKLWHGGDIVNTVVHHTGADAAIVTEQGPRVRLLHSIVAYHNYDEAPGSSYNMTFGYDAQAAQTVEIIDSLIFNHSGGAYTNNKSTVRIENSLFHGIKNGNIIETSKGLIKLAGGPASIQTKGLGSANIVASPGIDTTTFHLQSGSAAINKGKALATDYPKSDRSNHPRVKGGTPDLGPYEDF